MTEERIQQIRTTLAHNPRQADAYVDELLRAVERVVEERDEAREFIRNLEEEYVNEGEEHLGLEASIDLTVFRMYDSMEEAELKLEELKAGGMVSRDDVFDLQMRISDLESDNATLREEVRKLMTQLAERPAEMASLREAYAREMRLASKVVQRYAKTTKPGKVRGVRS
jgi:predicted  nucleic acid-binding Zn-ribbon protein